MIYFDHNATTPLSEDARSAWLKVVDEAWGNPSSGYRHGSRAKALLEQARTRMAKVLGVEAGSLVFCSGATEACNLWLRSFFEKRQQAETLLVSELDHSCVVEACKQLHPNSGAIKWFIPGATKAITEQLSDIHLSSPGLAGVVMMAANNVSGEKYDWRNAAQWCRRQGIPFFCDATQWFGKYPTDGFAEVDFFCGSAHKFGGPKGVGFLKTSKKFKSVCGQIGGGQEAGMRAGTEDVAGIQAMVAAFEKAAIRCDDPVGIDLRMQWKRAFVERLLVQIPGCILHGSIDETLWNTVFVSMPEHTSGWWIQQLDRRGFAVAAGAACSTSNSAPSHLLTLKGIPDVVAKRTLRFSAGWDTDGQDWQELLSALVEVVSDSKCMSVEGAVEVISIDDL